jgi:hypothetical protein
MIDHDLELALDAIEEIMSLDKGPSEEEWCDWCNKYLSLMKRYDREKYVMEFC